MQNQLLDFWLAVQNPASCTAFEQFKRYFGGHHHFLSAKMTIQ
jgi:hypothetical protein